MAHDTFPLNASSLHGEKIKSMYVLHERDSHLLNHQIGSTAFLPLPCFGLIYHDIVCLFVDILIELATMVIPKLSLYLILISDTFLHMSQGSRDSTQISTQPKS